MAKGRKARRSGTCKIITVKGKGKRCMCKGKFRKMASCKR